jgi:hypothetical protein
MHWECYSWHILPTVRKQFSRADKSAQRKQQSVDLALRLNNVRREPDVIAGVFGNVVDGRKAQAHNAVRLNNQRPTIVPKITFTISHLETALLIVKSLEDLTSDTRSAVMQSIRSRIAEASPLPTTSAAQPSLDSKERPCLPKLPAGLKWPTETYSQAHRARNVNIVQFLQDPNGWFPLIQAGIVTRPLIRKHDISAEHAIVNYLRDGRNKLPANLRIPTKRELNDLALAKGMSAIARDPRLAQVMASRLRQGTKLPKIT